MGKTVRRAGNNQSGTGLQHVDSIEYKILNVNSSSRFSMFYQVRKKIT